MTRTAVVYVYPVMGGEHETYARRFAQSYRRFLPATKHRLFVVSNGGQPTTTMKATFAGLDVSWLVHDDSGWDIGAYRYAARVVPDCDLMVFFGGSSHVRGARWLERMIESFEQHGEAVYGAMGSLGVNIHIRTTAFWLSPRLLNRYPYPTTSDRGSRYNFEHSKQSLTMWALSLGLKAWMVTWDGTFQHWQWDGIPNGFHQGNQSALLAWDKHADPTHYKLRPAQSHAPPGAPKAVPQPKKIVVAAPPKPKEVVVAASKVVMPETPPQPPSLSLVYVVRESTSDFAQRFFTAYRSFNAGVAHDLVIAAVGFKDESRIKKSIWADVSPPPSIVMIPDPGFQFGVFREACRRLSTEHVCFLSEQSRPLVDGWLARLYAPVHRPKVGIAGASGSHQNSPHVRGNAFCIKRSLYMSMTERTTPADEGALQSDPSRSITSLVRRRGLSACIVGRFGERDIVQARDGRTFWWGAQDGLLVADDQTDDYANGSETRRAYLRAAGWPAR